MALDLPQSQSRQRLCVVPLDESVDRAEWMEEKESSGKGKGGRGRAGRNRKAGSGDVGCGALESSRRRGEF